MTDLLIRGGIVITMDETRRVLDDGAVAIKDGRITAVGPTKDVVARHGDAKQVIEARGRAILPGLIDGHAHAGQFDVGRHALLGPCRAAGASGQSGEGSA